MSNSAGGKIRTHHGPLGQEADRANWLICEREIDDADHQGIGADRKRHDLVVPHEIELDEIGEEGGGGQVGSGHDRQRQILGEGAGQIGFGEQSELGQDVVEALAGRLRAARCARSRAGRSMTFRASRKAPRQSGNSAAWGSRQTGAAESSMRAGGRSPAVGPFAASGGDEMGFLPGAGSRFSGVTDER